MDQHYTKEFSPHLDQKYNVIPVTGDSEEKDFFGKVMLKSAVVICTAQILYNAMINTEEDRHVELSGKCLCLMLYDLRIGLQWYSMYCGFFMF